MTEEELDRNVTLCCDVAARLQREGNIAESLALISAACALRRPKPVEPSMHYVMTDGVRVRFHVDGASPGDMTRWIATAITDAMNRRALPR